MTVERSLLMTQPSAAVYVENVFSTYLYTGTGATQTINNGVDLSTKGGMLWIKARTPNGRWHNIADTVRGRAYSIFTNSTSAQLTSPAGRDISSFNTDGFTLGPPDQTNTNNTGDPLVSWTFRKQPKFFDIVTYTGTGVARTISHNLGCVPGMIIVKKTNIADSWYVYHRSLTNTQVLLLDTNDAVFSGQTNAWNSTSPTSTEFSVGNAQPVNGNGNTYVAYLFADSNSGGFGATGTDSVVACGSYTGNGSTSGPTVTLGWEPQFVLTKPSSSTGSWSVHDNMRGFAVTGGAALRPNLADAEYSSQVIVPNSTGFNLINTSSDYNGNGVTYIYLAIRRGPMKVPTDATKVFAPVAYTGNGGTKSFTTNFVVDMFWDANPDKTWATSTWSVDRLRGAKVQLYTNLTNAESTNTAINLDSNTGVNLSGNFDMNGNTKSYITWDFQRAPGFFDVVCYTGTGSATTVAHNLGVAPQLIIVKSRSNTWNWSVYNQYNGNTAYMYLDSTIGSQSPGTGFWNDTTPTASVFSVGTEFRVNNSGATYVAYLFATCPGVSKVGSYTGTAAALNIDCGFAAGARFVMIKRTDTTGDWWVYDSARGISSGNDPYLFMNSTAAEVTNTNYVDAYATGFSLTATAPAGLNANGGTYIFLAIA